MQEETNEKTIALYIKTGKLTAQQLQKAMKALLAQMKKQHDKQKIPHGKQTLKQLMKQNAGSGEAAAPGRFRAHGGRRRGDLLLRPRRAGGGGVQGGPHQDLRHQAHTLSYKAHRIR